MNSVIILVLMMVASLCLCNIILEFGRYYPLDSLSEQLSYKDLSLSEVSVTIQYSKDDSSINSGHIMLDRNLIVTEKVLNASNFINSTQLQFESMKLLAIYELDLERVQLSSDSSSPVMTITIEWTNALMNTRPHSMIPLILNENYDQAVIPSGGFTKIIGTPSSVKFTIDPLDYIGSKNRLIFALGGYSKPVDGIFGRTYSVGDFPRSYSFKNQLKHPSQYLGIVMTKPDMIQTFSIHMNSTTAENESVNSPQLNSNYTTLYILQVQQQMFGGKKSFYFRKREPVRNVDGKLVVIKPDSTRWFYRTVDGSFKGVWSSSVTTVSCPEFGSDVCSATSDLPIYDRSEVGIVSEIDLEATRMIQVENGNNSTTDNSSTIVLTDGSSVNFQTVSSTIQPHYKVIMDGFQILSLKNIKISGRSSSKVVIYQSKDISFPNSTFYDSKHEISSTETISTIDLKHRSFSNSIYYLRFVNIDESQSDNTCYISFSVSVTPFTDDRITPEENAPIYPYIFIGIFGGIVAILIFISVVYIIWKKTRKPRNRMGSNGKFPSVSSQMSIQSEKIVSNENSVEGLDLEQQQGTNQTTQYYRMNE